MRYKAGDWLSGCSHSLRIIKLRMGEERYKLPVVSGREIDAAGERQA